MTSSCSNQSSHGIVSFNPGRGSEASPSKYIAAPGQVLFPYQEEDVLAALKMKSQGIYLGHEMGLGKTAMALCYCNTIPICIKRILIVCSANVRGVWQSEIDTWSWPKLQKVQVIEKGSDTIKKTSQVVIVSYDLCFKKPIARQLISLAWDIMICDEAHCLGNIQAKRTTMVLGMLYPKTRKTLFLSGSIVRDKIVNLYPVFHTIAPELFPRYWDFIERFVNYQQGKYGITLLGGKNLKELGRLARGKFLLRRRKVDVLSQLPPKLEQKVMLRLPELEQQSAEAARLDFAEEAQRAIMSGKEPSREVATLRRQLGEEKVPLVMSYILELLEEEEQQIGVFCYHRSVWFKLSELLYRHGIPHSGILGGFSLEARNEAIEDFRSGKTRVFLGSFAAAEGINLQTCSMCLFAEMSWSLKDNEQAQDRFHRIGQKNTVYIKYLLVEKSLDETVFTMYKRKAGDKRRAFDNE